jgi:hypothetical protein
MNDHTPISRSVHAPKQLREASMDDEFHADDKMDRVRRTWLLVALVVVLVGIVAAIVLVWMLAYGTAPEPTRSPS